jgi:hypothetical protein
MYIIPVGLIRLAIRLLFGLPQAISDIIDARQGRSNARLVEDLRQKHQLRVDLGNGKEHEPTPGTDQVTKNLTYQRAITTVAISSSPWLKAMAADAEDTVTPRALNEEMIRCLACSEVLKRRGVDYRDFLNHWTRIKR